MMELASALVSVAAIIMAVLAAGELSPALDRAGFRKTLYMKAEEREKNGRELLSRGQVFLARDVLREALRGYRELGDEKKAEEVSRLVERCRQGIREHSTTPHRNMPELAVQG